MLLEGNLAHSVFLIQEFAALFVVKTGVVLKVFVASGTMCVLHNTPCTPSSPWTPLPPVPFPLLFDDVGPLHWGLDVTNGPDDVQS